jgi:hypothetical protein
MRRRRGHSQTQGTSPPIGLAHHTLIGDWDNPTDLLPLAALYGVLALKNEFFDAAANTARVTPEAVGGDGCAATIPSAQRVKPWVPPLNRASVAAGVPPAVEGDISPPEVPGSWSPHVSNSWKTFLPTRWPAPRHQLRESAMARLHSGELIQSIRSSEYVFRPP